MKKKEIYFSENNCLINETTKKITLIFSVINVKMNDNLLYYKT